MSRPSPAEPLRPLSGTVYGRAVHGRLPAAFRAYLWPARSGASRAEGDGGRPLERNGERNRERNLELAYRAEESLPAARGEPLWRSEPEEMEAAGPFRLFPPPEGGDGFVLRVEGAERGRFLASPAGIDVEWAASADAAAHHLFAYALPLWLEARGVPVLHGSAVAVEGRAVGFLASSGTGKSVLAAELVRLGCGFLADDGLALERNPDGTWRCPPGPPLARLWPRALAGPLGLDPEPLPRVWRQGEKRRVALADLAGSAGTGGSGGAGGRGGPGESSDTGGSDDTGGRSDTRGSTGGSGGGSGEAPGEPAPPWTGRGAGSAQPLHALYVLHRRPEAEGEVRLSRLSPRETLVHLSAHGVAAAPATALGLAARRFELLAEAARQLPAWHLEYPSGANAPQRVLDALRSRP